MTEAGQLSMDDAIWHHGRVWWQVTRAWSGAVIFADEPEGCDQVRGLRLDPNDDVELATDAVERIKLDLHDANRRMCVRRGGTGWEMARETARRCERELAALEGAGFRTEVPA